MTLTAEFWVRGCISQPRYRNMHSWKFGLGQLPLKIILIYPWSEIYHESFIFVKNDILSKNDIFSKNQYTLNMFWFTWKLVPRLIRLCIIYPNFHIFEQNTSYLRFSENFVIDDWDYITQNQRINWVYFYLP